MVTSIARICVLATLVAWAHGTSRSSESAHRRVPKQIHTKAAAVVETDEDHNAAETHFGGEAAAADHGHGKYFMYQHVPHKDHYEFGYRRGNEHHFKERYEKAQPHHGHFKTKARWGDKHGGYGEHYWDYNHGDHHGDEEGSDDEGGDGTNPVPDYRLSEDTQDDRVKREPSRGVPEGRSPTLDHPGLSLAYDQESGTVVDEATGRRFLLTPLN